MTDKLDQILLEKAAEVERLDAILVRGNARIARVSERLKRAQIELDAFKQAAAARPVSPGDSRATAAGFLENLRKKEEHPKNPGRQKGAISYEWRAVLQDMCKTDRYVKLDKIRAYTIEHGIPSGMANIRERMRAMGDAGLIEGGPKRGFKVTKLARAKFNFDQPKEFQPTPRETIFQN